MQTLLNKIFIKIKILYNYIRIELNLNFNIPYDFLLKEPIATEQEYIDSQQNKNLSYENINYFENKLGYSINKEWLNNLALHTQVVIKNLQLIINMEEFYIVVLEIICLIIIIYKS